MGKSEISKKLRLFDKVLDGGIKPFEGRAPKASWRARKDTGKNSGGWVPYDEWLMKSQGLKKRGGDIGVGRGLG